MYAREKKICSLLLLFLLCKNGTGFTEIMHIEVEKKFHQVK